VKIRTGGPCGPSAIALAEPTQAMQVKAGFCGWTYDY
jgi:hypothetical protein